MAFYETHNSGPAFSRTPMRSTVDMQFPMHLHNSFELLFVQEGQIEVGIGKACYRPRCGDMVLIPPNAPHSYHTVEHSKILLMIFNADYLSELCSRPPCHPVIPNANALLAALLEAGEDHLLFRAALYRVAAAYAKNPPLAAASTLSGGFAATFSEYLTRHCTEPLREGDVARAMGYHPRYLSALIRRYFGAPFCRVLNDYRVRLACERLRNSTESITSIYLAVGFDSQSSFNRNFKAAMGITPLAYRHGYHLGRSNHT